MLLNDSKESVSVNNVEIVLRIHSGKNVAVDENLNEISSAMNLSNYKQTTGMILKTENVHNNFETGQVHCSGYAPGQRPNVHTVHIKKKVWPIDLVTL